MIANVVKSRMKRLKALRADPDIVPTIKQFYKNNPAQFIDDWFITYDPRKTPAYIPFTLFEKQKEYIGWLSDRFHKKEDGVVEKCRDAGVTWLCVGFAVYLWSFFPGVKIAFGAHKQDKVDRLGDADSIFEKIRIVLRRLPREFLPEGFRLGKHGNFLKIINPQTDAIISGESGDQIGRGGRSSIYFKDESAFYERPLLIEAALSENSDVKIDVSTFNGVGNPFYLKRFSGKYPVFVFDWRDDPRKDDAWYADRVAKLDPVILAQEIDRNPSASLEDVCIPMDWILASVALGKVLKSELKNYGAGTVGLDVGGGGTGKNAAVAKRGPFILPPETWKGNDSISTAHKALDYMRVNGVTALNFDSVGVGAGVLSAFRRVPGAKTNPVNVGNPPTKTIWPDGKRSFEKFKNLKMELWWRARSGIEKAYQYYRFLKGLPNGKKHELPELLLLPDSPTLAGQLGIPRVFRTSSGLMILESKDKLKTRGVPSPDEAEGLILSLYDAPEPLTVGSF